MALDPKVTQRIIKGMLESSPNVHATIELLKNAGVTVAEITHVALDHPAVKARYDEIGKAINAHEGKWPLPIKEETPVEELPVKDATAPPGTPIIPPVDRREAEKTDKK